MVSTFTQTTFRNVPTVKAKEMKPMLIDTIERGVSVPEEMDTPIIISCLVP